MQAPRQYQQLVDAFAVWAAMEYGMEKAPKKWVLIDVRRQPNDFDCGVLAIGHICLHVVGSETQDVDPIKADELRAVSAVDMVEMTYNRMPPGSCCGHMGIANAQYFASVALRSVIFNACVMR